MVQSWENFFSQDGGSMTNNFQFGMASLVVDFGMGLLMHNVHPSVERMVTRGAGARILGQYKQGVQAAKDNFKPSAYRPGYIKKYPGIPALLDGGYRSGTINDFTYAHQTQKITDPNDPLYKQAEARHEAYVNRQSALLKSKAKSTFKSEKASIRGKFANLNNIARSIGWGYLALGVASMAEAITTPGLSQSANRSNNQMFGDSTPMDSQGAYTQRQRALMAIHESQLGIRGVIGQEAGYLHK